MINNPRIPPEVKVFRPPDLEDQLRRASQTGRPSVDDYGQTAVNEFVRLSALPPGQARDEELTETARSFGDCLREKQRRAAESLRFNKKSDAPKWKRLLRKLFGRGRRWT